MEFITIVIFAAVAAFMFRGKINAWLDKGDK